MAVTTIKKFPILNKENYVLSQNSEIFVAAEFLLKLKLTK